MTAYGFIRENRGEYGVKQMAALLGVSRAAYYKWAAHGVCGRRKASDAKLLELVRAIADRHKGRYGSPRIRLELSRGHGVDVGGKRVARLMRENGLCARRPRRRPRTTDSSHGMPVCRNILGRDFKAQKPGSKWVSDITYLRTLSGWVYLTVVIDLFDRKVVGWALSRRMDCASTAEAALAMAVRTRPPEQGLVFHSDRGSQYCSALFRDALLRRCPTVRRSMGRRGCCWDNACAESFFATLKREPDTLGGRHCEARVRQSVFMYIEAYYNRIRAHSAIDYAAPDMFCLGKTA